MSSGGDDPESEAPTLAPEVVALPEPRPPSGWEADAAHRLREPTEVSSSLPASGVEPQVGDVLDGKYELTRILGAGGMGTVFQGQHRDLGIPVAVKVMKPRVAAEEEYVRRFRREAHAASVLNHANVVRILDFGKAGTFYIVMEFIEGPSVEDWLEQIRVPPPLAEVEAILLQVLDALEAAHQAGIVHRDLKPENIILSVDAQGRRVVKVVDFGLAHIDDVRDEGPTLTKADTVAGTPTYMSPEQCRSLAVGPSTDLYAFGCILTTMLQLRPPFEAEASMDVISNQMFMPPPPLDRPPEAEPVPPLLEKLRLELLAKRVHQRPADAPTVRARLVEALDPDLSEARQPRRKADLPFGSRAERVLESYVRPSDAPGAPAPTLKATVWLVGDGGGIDGACVTGLAALGARVVRDSDHGAPELVLLDAVDVDAATNALRQLSATHPETPVLVCLRELDTARMNLLIEAGAADVARSPIASDRLAKKLKRLVRR